MTEAATPTLEAALTAEAAERFGVKAVVFTATRPAA
jgi:hypothetical protein